MRKQMKHWIRGLMAAGLSVAVLTGCSATVADRQSADAGDSVGNTQESSVGNRYGESAGTGGAVDPESGAGEDVTAAKSEASVETAALERPERVVIVKQLEIDLMLENVEAVATNGERLYIRGNYAIEEKGDFLPTGAAVVSCKADGTEVKLVQKWAYPAEKVPEMKEGETRATVHPMGMCVDADGNLIEILEEHHWTYGKDQYEIKTRLVKVDHDGSEIWSTLLPRRIHLRGMTCVGNQIVICLEACEEQVYEAPEIMIYDSEGILKARHTPDVMDLIRPYEAGARAYIYELDHGHQPMLRELDLQTAIPGEAVSEEWGWSAVKATTPEDAGYTEWLGEGFGYDLLIRRNDGVWGYQIGENEPQKVLTLPIEEIGYYYGFFVPVGERDLFIIPREPSDGDIKLLSLIGGGKK